MRKYVLLTAFLALCSNAYGQVGINTTNPQGIFHVDGAKDNNPAGAPTAQQQNNDFIVTPEGNVGVGTAAPVTRLDTRSAGNTDNSIAIGKTVQTAPIAAAGAIRYNSYNGGKLQYSDGMMWMDLVSFPEKAIVIANNTTGDRFTQNVEKQIIYNNKFVDNYNAFYRDTSIGINNTAINNLPNGFTAPRDGIYLVSATVDLVGVVVLSAKKAEIRYIVFSKDNNGNPTTTTVQKCMKIAPGLLPLNTQTPVQCLSGVKLKKGDVLQVRFFEDIFGTGVTGINTRTSASVTSSDYGFLNLSILEQ